MKFTFPNISIFNNMSDDMGIDLGTANTLVHCKDKVSLFASPPLWQWKRIRMRHWRLALRLSV